MNNDVKWDNQNRKLAPRLGKKRGDLRGIVRFLAHRAAERTWKSMQQSENGPQQKQGESQGCEQ
ncbi:hypothetical protein [Roseobacter sp. MH60115]|uniref:hypothetical protein n=1 Tax=Roseobacter sp. MH60115 TaxID=2785324 RepID=UPI0018A3305A|nr:hypothetical protein [Roseobacter sp. MH60115]